MIGARKGPALSGMKPVLYSYQKAGMRALLAATEATLLVAPTGAGKTVIVANAVRRMTKGAGARRVLIVVHRREILAQWLRELRAAGFADSEIGICSAGRRDGLSRQVIVGTVMTVDTTRFATDIGVLVVDEAHHIAAPTYRAIVNKHRQALLLGATATPYRLDGFGLGHWFTRLLEPIKVSELVDRGNLARPSVWSVAPDRLPNVRHVRTTATRDGVVDYHRADLAKVLMSSWLMGDIVEHLKLRALGLRTLVFCVSVLHAEAIAELCNASGLVAARVDGKTPLAERDRIMRAWRERRIQVLTNCDLFSEGLDMDCDRIECGVLARPTKSRGLVLQQCGRVMRRGGPCVILDHAGNCLRHNMLPGDDQEHCLVETTEASRGRVRGVKVCRKCLAVVTRKAIVCQNCGTEFPSIPRTEPDLIDGHLIEVNAPEQSEVDAEYQRALQVFVGSPDPMGMAFRWTTEKYPGHQPTAVFQ